VRLVVGGALEVIHAHHCGGRLENREENVGFEHRCGALEDRRHAPETGTGVDVLGGQLGPVPSGAW
jgi:hypothetical protein